MLSIQSSNSNQSSCTPNIVPCRIHYTGPTKITKRYWAPQKDKDDVSIVHFRGRKLHGRHVKLSKNYEGIILKPTESILPQTFPQTSSLRYEDEDELDQEEEELLEPTKILEKISTFDELVVWGHDQTPTSEDAFAKNVEEWISFAEAIHKNDDTTPNGSNSHTQADVKNK